MISECQTNQKEQVARSPIRTEVISQIGAGERRTITRATRPLREILASAPETLNYQKLKEEDNPEIGRHTYIKKPIPRKRAKDQSLILHSGANRLERPKQAMEPSSGNQTMKDKRGFMNISISQGGEMVTQSGVETDGGNVFMKKKNNAPLHSEVEVKDTCHPLTEATESQQRVLHSPLEADDVSNNGEGKVFHYDLIGIRQYYNQNPNEVEAKPHHKTRLSASEEKMQELRPSSLFVSKPPKNPSRLSLSVTRGGIVKFKRRKHYSLPEINKIVLIQTWYKAILLERRGLSSNIINGGIVQLSEEFIQTEMNRRTTKVIFQSRKPIEKDPNGMLIRKILPLSTTKTNKTNYEDYCREFISSQVVYQSPPGKTRLKSQKKTNNQLLKSQLMDLWVNESQVTSKATLCYLPKPKDSKLSMNNVNSISIIHVQKVLESKGMNTANWNEKLSKDSEASLYLERGYKLKNWNKVNHFEQFSLELKNPFDSEPFPFLLLQGMKRRLIQQQLNNISEKANDIVLKGKSIAPWNKTNFAERFHIDITQIKEKAQLSAQKPISLDYSPEGDTIFGFILTRDQLKRREKLLKVQHDQCEVNYTPYYCKWNSTIQEQKPLEHTLFFKYSYKKRPEWNAKNNTTSFDINHLGKEKPKNQFGYCSQFSYNSDPIFKYKQWNENTSKKKEDSFGINKLYEKSQWNKTNMVQSSDSFREFGKERIPIKFADLFFSLTAKRSSDYDILFSDNEKEELYKLTKSDIQYLWNKLNKVERIAGEDKEIIDMDNEVNQPPRAVLRSKAAPKKKPPSESYEIIDTANIQLSFNNRTFPKKNLKIDNQQASNKIAPSIEERCKKMSIVKVEMSLKSTGSQWNKKNKTTTESNLTLCNDIWLYYISRWNKKNTKVAENSLVLPNDACLYYKGQWNKKNKKTEESSLTLSNDACLYYKGQWNKKNKKAAEGDMTLSNDIWLYYIGQWNKKNKKVAESSLTVSNDKWLHYINRWNKKNKKAEDCSLSLSNDKWLHYINRWNKKNHIHQPDDLFFSRDYEKTDWNEKNEDVSTDLFSCVGRETDYQPLALKEWKLKCQKEANSLSIPKEKAGWKWNRINSKEIERTMHIHAKAQEPKWNKLNKADESINNITIPRELANKKWNLINKEVKSISLFIPSPRLTSKLDIRLVRELWKKKNQISEEENKVCLLGKRNVPIDEKWNRDNCIESGLNHILFKGEMLNFVLVLEMWKKTITQEKEVEQLTFEGLSNKDKWNKIIKSGTKKDIEIRGDPLLKWNRLNKVSSLNELDLSKLVKPQLEIEHNSFEETAKRKPKNEITSVICHEFKGRYRLKPEDYHIEVINLELLTEKAKEYRNAFQVGIKVLPGIKADFIRAQGDNFHIPKHKKSATPTLQSSSRSLYIRQTPVNIMLSYANVKPREQEFSSNNLLVKVNSMLIKSNPKSVTPSFKEVTLSMQQIAEFDYGCFKDDRTILRSKKGNVRKEEVNVIDEKNQIAFQVAGKAQIKRIDYVESDSLQVELIGKPIKNKNRLSENKEKHKWDDSPLISETYPFELLQEEDEEMKKKKDVQRRKRIEAILKIDHDYNEIHSKAKSKLFDMNQLKVIQSCLQCECDPNTNIFFIWKSRMKIGEDCIRFFYPNKSFKHAEWNQTNRKEDIAKYEVIHFPQSWDTISEPINSIRLNIKGKSLKDKWNKLNLKSQLDDSSINLPGEPLSTKWNKAMSLSSYSYEISVQKEEKKVKQLTLKQGIDAQKPRISAGIPKPIKIESTSFDICKPESSLRQYHSRYIIVKWKEEASMDSQMHTTIHSSHKKFNDEALKPSETKANAIELLGNESNVFLLKSKRTQEPIGIKLVKNTFFTILPPKFYHKKKWNVKNQIEKINLNESLQLKGRKTQWTELEFDKQNDSVDYSGRKTSYSKVQLERSRKDWNDINQVQQSERLSTHVLKSAKPIKKQIESRSIQNVQSEHIEKSLAPKIVHVVKEVPQKEIVIREDPKLKVRETQIEVKIYKQEASQDKEEDREILEGIHIKGRNNKVDRYIDQLSRSRKSDSFNQGKGDESQSVKVSQDIPKVRARHSMKVDTEVKEEDEDKSKINKFKVMASQLIAKDELIGQNLMRNTVGVNPSNKHLYENPTMKEIRKKLAKKKENEPKETTKVRDNYQEWNKES